MTPERRHKLLTVLQKRQPNFTVVLENVFDPHNMAAVMRTCNSVGIQDVYIISSMPPPQKEWGFKSGSSAKKWLTLHNFTNTEECFAQLRDRYDKILTTHLSDNALGLYEIDFTGSIAVVFGNEKSGVSEEARSLADGNFIIPQVGIIRSLNISVACAVTIYEAFRQKQSAGHYNHTHISLPGSKQLLNQWGFTADDAAFNNESEL